MGSHYEVGLMPNPEKKPQLAVYDNLKHRFGVGTLPNELIVTGLEIIGCNQHTNDVWLSVPIIHEEVPCFKVWRVKLSSSIFQRCAATDGEQSVDLSNQSILFPLLFWRRVRLAFDGDTVVCINSTIRSLDLGPFWRGRGAYAFSVYSSGPNGFSLVSESKLYLMEDFGKGHERFLECFALDESSGMATTGTHCIFGSNTDDRRNVSQICLISFCPSKVELTFWLTFQCEGTPETHEKLKFFNRSHRLFALCLSGDHVYLVVQKGNYLHKSEIKLNHKELNPTGIFWMFTMNRSGHITLAHYNQTVKQEVFTRPKRKTPYQYTGQKNAQIVCYRLKLV